MNPQTIRYYEREGILPQPQRRKGSNYRDYGEDSLRTLCFIRQAQAAGFTLREITELLRARVSARSCAEVAALIHARLEEIRRKIKELRNFERSLRRLEDACRDTPRQRAGRGGVSPSRSWRQPPPF